MLYRLHSFNFKRFFEAKEANLKNIEINKLYQYIPNSYNFKFNFAAAKIIQALKAEEKLAIAAKKYSLRAATIITEVKKPQTTVSVIDDDCFNAVKKLCMKHPNTTAMLNMADRHILGGNVFNGAVVSEGRLLLTTDIAASLLFYAHQNKGFRGLDINGNTCVYYNDASFNQTDVLYSTNTVKYELDRHENLQPLNNDQYFSINIITSAALRYDVSHAIAESKEIDNSTKRILYQTIYNQILTIIETGNTAAVLNAFGCGALQHDPKLIAKIYRDVLSLPEFFGRLTVQFAIPKSTGDENFVSFTETFKQPLVKSTFEECKAIYEIIKIESHIYRKRPPKIQTSNYDETSNLAIVRALLQVGAFALAANKIYQTNKKKQHELENNHKAETKVYLRAKL